MNATLKDKTSARSARPKNPNQMGDREAMGLTDAFVARTPAVLLGMDLDLRFLDAAELVTIAQDPATPFHRRHAAGALLGLVGDPRIRPMDPPMLAIPGAKVEIGTDGDRLRQTKADWAHVGLTETWLSKESPRHGVVLESFAMMRYPVTNLEYRLFLERSGATWLPSSWKFGIYPVLLANHPVWSIPPEAADAYARWLSGSTGRSFRLPREAEWEYAASGGRDVEYPWGDRFDPDASNTVEAGPYASTPIGIFPGGRSAFGIDDMAGNVEEYVADDYAPYPGGSIVRDDLLDNGPYRVARGGSFTRYGDLTRCARRHGPFPRDVYPCGFRLVETV